MTNMWIFLALCWMLTMDIMLIVGSSLAIPLNMAEDSVDDMYEGCNETMKNILDTMFSNERNHVGWKKSDNCSKEKFEKRSAEDMALTKDHLQAICMYTGYVGYDSINKDIRTKGRDYGSSKFKYHTLHFFLTSAIQILNSQHRCITSYRRTKSEFDGEVNHTFRFGQFASSSNESDLSQFGTTTCFKIRTCLGAYLKHYPSHGTGEEEVLIPPYETFTIIDVVKQPQTVQGLENCNVVYVVEHKGYESNLNCKVSNQYPNSSREMG